MSRKFEFNVRLPDGKKWSDVDEPILLEAFSLDELCATVHAALLGLGRVDPASSSVAIESVFDSDEMEWVPVSAFDDIPAKVHLRVRVLAEPYLDRTEAPELLKESRRLLGEHTTIGCCNVPSRQAAICLRAACSAAFPGVALTDVQSAVKPVPTDDPLNREHMMTAVAITCWGKAFKDAEVPHPGDKEVAERVASACLPPGVVRCVPIAVPNNKKASLNYFLHLEMHPSMLEAVRVCEEQRQEAEAQRLASLVDPAKLQTARDELKGRERTTR